MKTKRILLILLLCYLVAFFIYATSRILVRHGKVVRDIQYSFAEGYGHKELVYFDKIFIIRPYEPSNMRDIITSTFLILTGCLCFITYVILRNVPHGVNHKPLWLLFSIGFLYLGLDELFLFHEFMGLNLAHLYYNTNSLDNILDKDFNGLIIVLYAVLALVVFVVRFSFFKEDRLALLFLGIGFLFQGSAAIIDYLWNNLLVLQNLFGPLKFLVFRDEFFEMTASAMYFSAFILYSLTSISEYYEVRDGNYTLRPLERRH